MRSPVAWNRTSGNSFASGADILPEQTLTPMTPTTDANLKHEIKQLIVEQLRLKDVTPDSLDDSESLVEGSLSLDSIDFLELTVALEKKYGLKITESEEVEKIFVSVNSIAGHVAQHLARTNGA